MKTRILCSGLGLLATLGPLSAQISFTYLHHFGDPAVRASFAEPISTGPDGTVYGVTQTGGANNGGLLYRLSPDGAAYTVLREFGVAATNGASPRGAVLVGSDGFLYGGTLGGGTNGTGVIYRVGADGANYSVVHHLTPGISVVGVQALINGPGNRIFGAVNGEGVVAFDPGGANYQKLNAGDFSEGGALFAGTDGRLYAVEPIGGNSGHGVFYRLNANGSGLTVLRVDIPFRNEFTVGGTVQPFSAVQATNGSILGMEFHSDFFQPDADGNFVFRTDTNGAVWTEAGLTGGPTPAPLDGPPTAFFQGSDGAFYGAIRSGGPTTHGYVFKFQSFADPLATWQNLFDWPATYTGGLGISSKSLLEGAGQKLYGASLVGGRLGGGAVFRLNRDGTGFAQLFNFAADGDGTNAAPPVIFATDGRLYGTTAGGGDGQRGTVFRVDPVNGDYRVIGQFNSNAEGSEPAGGVLDGQDGFLYGVTVSGGSQNLGTIFKLRYDGSEFTVLYNIRTNRPNTTSPVDPSSITGALVMDTNGWLYGVGATGGSAGRGGVFRARKDGTLFTNIHNFIVGEARRPVGGLLLARDGKLYGTTENGGTADSGVLYRLNPDGGAFQILRSFGGVGDGANPNAPLWQDAAGVLYGTTFGGGTNNLGTVFRFNPTNSSYTVLHHFGASPDGRRPSAGLVEAADGSLVGTTRFGGSGVSGQQLGTIFQLNKDGTGYKVLRSFTGAGGDGESLFSRLALGPAGNFFGTTSLGGSRGLGTVFRFALGGTGIALALAPTNTTLQSGQTRTFTAGGGAPPYTFSFGQNLSGGTVNPASGLYTAGPTNTVLDSVRVTDSLAATALATIAVAPLNLTVTAATPQEFLDHLTHIEGNLVLDNADTLTALLLPNLTSVTGDLIIQNNNQLQALDLSALQMVGGNFVITINPSLTNVSAGALTNVAGAVDVSDNQAASSIALDSLTSVGGSIDVSDNTNANTVDLNALASVGGSVDVSNNSNASTVDLHSLTSVGGSIDVSDNTNASTVNLNSLTSVGGSVDVSNNSNASTVDLHSLTSVGGSVNVSDNTNASTVNLNSLTSVGGSVDISNNSNASTVGLDSLTSVGGSVNVSNNTNANTVDLNSLASVGGNVTISSNAPNATTDLSSLNQVGGGTNAAMITLQQGTFVFTNGFTIPTNVTFAGFGTLAGSVTNKGAISPGASAGRFDSTGNLALAASSALRLELGGYAPGQSDFLGVNGSVTLGGTLTVTLINAFPGELTNGASFTLLTAGSPITGAFANVPSGGTLTTTDGQARFTVRYAGQTSVQLTDAVRLNPDTDGDGASDADELAAGTDPNDAASVFRILPLQPEAGGVRITWSTVGGKSYRVQTNGGLANPFGDFGPLITVPGTGESTTNLLDSGAVPAATTRYYRVRLGP